MKYPSGMEKNWKVIVEKYWKIEKARIWQAQNKVVKSCVHKVKSIQPGMINWGVCECLQAKGTINIYYGKADALNVLNVINVRLLNSLNGLNVYQHPTQLTTRHN